MVELASSIYQCRVVHNRVRPKKNFFQYGIFTFLIDLDELNTLDKKLFGFRRNAFSLFGFYDKDHLDFGKGNIQSNILHCLKEKGMDTNLIGKIYLLTNLRVLGYVFNPVSFYWVYSQEGKLISCLVEVGNTFGEQKPYLLYPKPQADSLEFPFDEIVDKFFYVSPFIQLDTAFHFRIGHPSESLHIQIHSYQKPESPSQEHSGILYTGYMGKKKKMTSQNLVFYFFRYPLVTVKVIGAIHYQALKLFLKKLPFLRKNENLEKQIGVHFVGKSTHIPIP